MIGATQTAHRFADSEENDFESLLRQIYCRSFELKLQNYRFRLKTLHFSTHRLRRFESFDPKVYHAFYLGHLGTRKELKLLIEVKLQV